jgi:phthiodiolone/phenolphthiodiolone dimycocerosates ketoreductase
MTRPVTFAYPFDNHRSTPLALAGQFAGALERSKLIDYLWLWDELSGWFPGNLWRPENTPAAEVIDSNSLYDPAVEAAFALAHNPTANIRLTTDAVRTNPALLLRQVLTLANGTEGKIVTAIGAGELRQSKPFGFKRSEGLARLEDTFVLLTKLLDETEPFSYQGKHWTFKNATIGNIRPAIRPEFWALGGGPALIDIAARYADGFESATPQAIPTVDAYAETVDAIRGKVAGYGRDPDRFGFGIWLICVMHDDQQVIEQVLANPLVRYFAGQFGRLDQQMWRQEGIQPVMPDGWHYAIKWAPFEQTAAEIDDIVSRVSPEMARKAFHCGTPAELAALCARFVDIGVTNIGILDMTPLALGPAEGQESVRRSMEIAATVKQAVAA